MLNLTVLEVKRAISGAENGKTVNLPRSKQQARQHVPHLVKLLVLILKLVLVKLLVLVNLLVLVKLLVLAVLGI